MPDWNVSERAAALHREALVWDGHAGFEYLPGIDLDQLYRWRDSGTDFLSLNIAYDVKPWTLAVEAVSCFRHWVHAHAEEFVLVQVADDVRRAKQEGKLAISFDIEGMRALNEDLGMVELYHRLGVRQMLIAYNLNNPAGGGCHDEDIGLTAFGRAVIEQMNRVGMLVDCSHSAYRSTMDAMEISTAPVIFSHSNARTLCDHERNIVDEQIDACAATGGLIAITGIGLFLETNGASVAAMVRHVDYMADRIGIERVGISLDYAWPDDGLDNTFETHPQFWPTRQYPSAADIGFVAPEDLPALTEALLDRGYSEDAVRGVMGENFLRVAGQVWRASALV